MFETGQRTQVCGADWRTSSWRRVVRNAFSFLAGCSCTRMMGNSFVFRDDSRRAPRSGSRTCRSYGHTNESRVRSCPWRWSRRPRCVFWGVLRCACRTRTHTSTAVLSPQCLCAENRRCRADPRGCCFAAATTRCRSCALVRYPSALPGQRYHPAVIAQASATIAEMYGSRFWLAIGSGEVLNEAITGNDGSPADRSPRLTESADVIRRF
jgi:hypothetical protein